MPISASQIVQVNPRLLKPGGKDLELNGLLLSQSDTIPAGVVLPFADPESVGAYFGLTSDEYRLANIYFLGYVNSFIKPRVLYVARHITAPAAPWLRGGPVTARVADIAAVTAGEITLTLGSHTATLTGLDFGSVTSYSDAAVILQAAIRAETAGGAARSAWTAATVAYISLFNAFVITGGDAGTPAAGGASIDYAANPSGSTLADLFKLTLQGGGTLSQGSEALTEAETMEGVLQQTTNWVTFTTVWQPTEDEALGFAHWANSKGVGYLYVFHDADARNLQPGNTGTVAHAMRTAKLSAVTGMWGTADYAAFILSTAASIDYDRNQGAITVAFKAQPGLAANVETSVDAVNITAQGLNFYGNYATRNDQFVFLYPGVMFGDYSYIDVYCNAVWLINALQASLMVGLTATPRVPYTDEGYALIRAWLQDPINRALRNGVIDPGVTLSETQKAQVNREAGRNISTELNLNGYYVQVLDPAPNVRVQRGSPIVNFWYTYGGSVHRLAVAATALV